MKCWQIEKVVCCFTRKRNVSYVESLQTCIRSLHVGYTEFMKCLGTSCNTVIHWHNAASVFVPCQNTVLLMSPINIFIGNKRFKQTCCSIKQKASHGYVGFIPIAYECLLIPAIHFKELFQIRCTVVCRQLLLTRAAVVFQTSCHGNYRSGDKHEGVLLSNPTAHISAGHYQSMCGQAKLNCYHHMPDLQDVNTCLAKICFLKCYAYIFNPMLWKNVPHRSCSTRTVHYRLF